jgi:hypothetical protein
MDDTFPVDVEAPGVDLITIPLEQAMEDYLLDGQDIRRLRMGETVWYKDTAITMHQEDSEND